MSTRQAALKQLQRLNSQLDQIDQRLKLVDSSLMNIRPGDNKWSVVQILQHLMIVESLNLKYIKYKIGQGTTFRKQKLWTTIKLWIYFIVTRMPFKFKAPAAIAGPPNEDDYETTMIAFKKIRDDYQQFIDSCEGSFFSKASCKHVLVGQLTLQNMMLFFEKHTQHHHNQIFRTVIAVSQ